MSTRQPSRGSSSRSTIRAIRAKPPTPKPQASAKSTYENILDCQDRIFQVIDNFDRIEELDRDRDTIKVEKPDDSAYVLRYNEQDLVQLSESIGKMAFVEADFGIEDGADTSIEQTLNESNELIESMILHKNEELRKIKELVEKFRQLRRDQELQLGNTIRDIKESSGVRGLEQRLLEREMQALRLRSECEKKEELLKLVISGLEETEQSIRDMCEQVEISNIQKMNEMVKKTERELSALKQASEAISGDLKEWQQRLRNIMKDAENTEIDAIRKKKAKLAVTLSKVNDDYAAAFTSHAQTLKYLVLTEKRANDNEYSLDKIATDRDAKKQKALEAKVEELQDSIAIGKVKLEELEAFLGDNSGCTKRGTSAKRSTMLRKTDSGLSDGAMTKKSLHGSAKSQTDANKQYVESLSDDANGSKDLTHLHSLLPDSEFGSFSSAKSVNSVNANGEGQAKKVIVNRPPSLRPFRIAHICERSSLLEIRALSRCILMPSHSGGCSGAASPRKGPNIAELLKVDSLGAVYIPERYGQLKGIDSVKEVLSLMRISSLPVQSALHKEEDVDMDIKEKRLRAFATSDQTSEKLLDLQNAEAIENGGNDTRLSDCKSKILQLLVKKEELPGLSKEVLSSSLAELRSQLASIMSSMAEEENAIEKQREKRLKQDEKWDYLSGKLAEDIIGIAENVSFSVPTDVKVYGLYSIVQAKRRIADFYRERVLHAQQNLESSDPQLVEVPATGVIAKYEDDISDEVYEAASVKDENESDTSSDISDSEDVQNSVHLMQKQSTPSAERVRDAPHKLRNRRGTSSILPTSVIQAFSRERVGQKSIGYRVLLMATEEEKREKEQQKIIEEEKQLEEEKMKEQKKDRRFTEFQEGLMQEIRASVNELLNKNKKRDMKGIGNHKREKTIGRLLVENEAIANRKKKNISGSNLEGEMNRQEMILSMIGRSTARATNAAETLKIRNQQQRLTFLQMQLQVGLEKRNQERAEGEESPSRELLPKLEPDEDRTGKVERFHWLAGKYNHNTTQQPSGIASDILSLISEDFDADGFENLNSIRDKLMAHTDSEINALIEKISFEISKNVIDNVPLSPNHAMNSNGGHKAARDSLSKVPEEDGCQEGDIEALLSYTSDEDNDDDKPSKSKLSKDDLIAEVVHYSSRRRETHHYPFKGPRKASVCEISIPHVLSSTRSSEHSNTIVNSAVILSENKKRKESSKMPHLPTLKLTFTGDENKSVSPGKKKLPGNALHGRYGGKLNLFTSDFHDEEGKMSLLGVKAGYHLKPETAVSKPIVGESRIIENLAVHDGLFSRPITSLDPEVNENSKPSSFVGIEKEQSVYSDYSATSMSTHIVIPAPEPMNDSRTTTAATVLATNNDLHFNDSAKGPRGQATTISGGLPPIDDSISLAAINAADNSLENKIGQKEDEEENIKDLFKRSGKGKDLSPRSMNNKSIVTNFSDDASSFFHDWSEGPETDFNPAILLSHLNEGSGSINAPRPPSYGKATRSASNDPSSPVVSTPLMRRISRGATPFRVNLPSRNLSNADRKILADAARRAAGRSGGSTSLRQERAHSISSQAGNLAAILAEIETKGREIQEKSHYWKDMNSTFASNIDELQAWQRELNKLKTKKNRKTTESLVSSEFSGLLQSNLKKKPPVPDVKIDSLLSGYTDVAPLFQWERTVKMKHSTVQELVNEIASHHANPGRMDTPAVVSLLPAESHHGGAMIPAYLENAETENNTIARSECDIPDNAVMSTQDLSTKASPVQKKIIKLPTRKMKTGVSADNPSKTDTLGCEVIRGKDGKHVYIIRKPASIC